MGQVRPVAVPGVPNAQSSISEKEVRRACWRRMTCEFGTNLRQKAVEQCPVAVLLAHRKGYCACS